MDGSRPIVGVTPNVVDGRVTLRRSYLDALIECGAHPIVLGPPTGQVDDLTLRATIEAQVDLCSAIVLSGGDDPATEPFGEPTHPKATLVHPDRQRYEVAMLQALEGQPDVPVLGVCLGMQLMALCAGGRLDQHMPESTETHAEHWDDREHQIEHSIDGHSALAEASARAVLGSVVSNHRQCVADAGALRVIARSHEGVIEAIDDPRRRFGLGVQWHPERTESDRLGLGIYRRLVEAARQPALR